MRNNRKLLPTVIRKSRGFKNQKGDINMKLKSKNNNLGQVTVVGLLMIFLAVMVLSSLMSTITGETTNVSAALSSSGFDTESTLYNLIPMFIIIVLLTSIAVYGGPQT